MAYPSVLAALAAFFGFVAVLAVGLRFLSPEPPPKGGMLDRRQESSMSFADFYHMRAKIKESTHAAATYGQERRSA
jgi:hypothetical protein